LFDKRIMLVDSFTFSGWKQDCCHDLQPVWLVHFTSKNLGCTYPSFLPCGLTWTSYNRRHYWTYQGYDNLYLFSLHVSSIIIVKKLHTYVSYLLESIAYQVLDNYPMHTYKWLGKFLINHSKKSRFHISHQKFNFLISHRCKLFLLINHYREFHFLSWYKFTS
jgi:uncharacterized protein YqjF (DUF2071 family)